MSTPARRKAVTRVSEAIARPARTGPQAVIAFAIVEFIDSFISDLTEKQYGAAVGLLILILAGLQVLVENWSGKAFFRAVPPTKQPVVDTVPEEPKDDPDEIVFEDEHPDELAGEPVDPEHSLDVDSFAEEQEDTR